MYAWVLGLAFGLICLPALARVVGIARRATASGRRWTLGDYVAEFIASWFIVLLISAAAATAFFVVFELAWRLTFEIPAQSWLMLCGFVLAVWAAGCMGHVASRLLWCERLRPAGRNP